MAAELKKDRSVDVQIVRGGLGELSVEIDGGIVVETNRLWYPTPSSIVAKVRAALD